MPTSNECCSNGLGNWKRNIARNTAKVTNMIEAGATCQRNMFSEINIDIKCNAKIMYRFWWCDAMTKDVRREEMGKFARWLNVPIMMKSALLALSLSLLFVIQPEISLRQSPSCLKERSVSAVDEDMYSWVLSTYKWWSNWWLWISELSGVGNNSGPRTESWGTLENKGTAFEKHFLIFIDWKLFIKNE